MAKGNGQPRGRRAFSAEFKLEAVRRAEERRAAGVPLTQVARELGVADDLLRKWRHQATERGGVPPGDVFPGQGRLTSEDEELRRLKRENARLQQEVAFLKSAAADSTGQRNRASNRAAGVSKASVFRGRAFSLAAT